MALGCEGSEGEAQQGDPTSCESIHMLNLAPGQARDEARRESSVCRRVPNAENFFARLWRKVSLISNID